MSKFIQLIAGVILALIASKVADTYGVPSEVKLAAYIGILVAFVIGWPFGLLVGHWLSRDSDVDTRGYRIVACANLVAWILPLVGMVVSGMTWIFYKRSDSSRAFYWIAGSLGALLAMVNAAWGAGDIAYGKLPLRSQHVDQAVAGTTERSWPRCQFATIEQWSDEDIETYCRNHEPSAEEMREFERLYREYEAQAARDPHLQDPARPDARDRGGRHRAPVHVADRVGGVEANPSKA